jgi:3-phosphoshikimate 1-carboxyvinyltransferase
VNVNLENSPDLFPVLAVLCGLAQGTSKLFGAPHLALKESNRIQKTFELLTKAGIKSQIVDGGLIIEGSNMKIHSKAFSFDPDHDHRMAMAAALLNMVGAKIQILNKEVVNKSFPEFWSIVGVQ